MSSVNVLGAFPQDHFNCSICTNIFNDPVTTPCGHSFCKTCLYQHWDQSEFCQCPTCKKRFLARPEISTNSIIEEISVQLKRRKLEIPEIADSMLQVQCDICTETAFRALKSCLVCQASYCSGHLEPHLRVAALKRHKLIDPVDNIEEWICPMHNQELDFYCREDQVTICSVCLETEHKDHEVVSLEEEGSQLKEKIETQMAKVKMMVEDRIQRIKKVTDYSSVRTEKAQKKINYMDTVFAKLVAHMQETQTKVKTTIEEKLKQLQDKDEVMVKELQEEISRLQKIHSELEELLQSDDPLHLLQTFQALSSLSETRDRTKTMVYSNLCLETVRIAVSQVTDSLQDLLKILTKNEIAWMKQYKESLIFDPSTAGSHLVVYDSGKRIKHHKYAPHTVTDTPERFGFQMVFTTTGFTSGRHYWEIQVGLHSNWDVGVANESVSRKGEFIFKPENGFYTIGKEGLQYDANITPYKALHLAQKPNNLGVYLDYEEGRVSFYDVDRGVHIYSFMGETFTEKMFPCFYLYSKGKKSNPMELSSMNDYGSFFGYFQKTEEKEKEKTQNSANSCPDVSEPSTSSQPEPVSK